jgi:hypothetical protein
MRIENSPRRSQPPVSLSIQWCLPFHPCSTPATYPSITPTTHKSLASNRTRHTGALGTELSLGCHKHSPRCAPRRNTSTLVGDPGLADIGSLAGFDSNRLQLPSVIKAVANVATSSPESIFWRSNAASCGSTTLHRSVFPSLRNVKSLLVLFQEFYMRLRICAFFCIILTLVDQSGVEHRFQ